MRALTFGFALLGAFAGFCLTFVGLLYLVNLWRLQPPRSWRNPLQTSSHYEPAPDYRAARAIYPYSVIPGGVASEQEVEASVAQDDIVARHYQGIRVSQLEPIRLNTPIEVYASFRNAAGIHWTAHTIRVPKGELLLSDGVNLIRGRCGNRLAFAPPATTTGPNPSPPPDDVPPEIVLDYGVPPILQAPPVFPGVPLTPTQTTARFWPPQRPPVVWCCTYAAVATGSGLSSSEKSAVFEPASALLLGSGGMLVIFWRARERSRRRAKA